MRLVAETPQVDKKPKASLPPESRDAQEPSKPANLAKVASLGGVDHKTFTDAQTAHAGDDGSSHLPDVTVPVALDKGVGAEHAKLLALADSQLATPEARQQFQADMDKFEKRADQQHLTPTQITNSYKQVERMLGPAPDSPIPASQRQELASQWMTRLGEPGDTCRQGWHDTCGFTYLESRLLSNDPDKISAKMAEVITTGQVSTIDWNKMPNGKIPTTLPTKELKLDPGSLKPDQEAQGLSPHADRREYVDQIAQVMEDSIRWDATSTTPTGKKIGYGKMKFEQSPVVERPSDEAPGAKPEDKSGESVAYIDPKTGKAVDINSQGYGFGGASTSTDLYRVNAAITGRFDQVMLEHPGKGFVVDQKAAIEVDSVSALQSNLERLQQTGAFPIGATVWANSPGVIDDYLVRHPEKTAAQVATVAHVYCITGLDSNGNVEVYNPWGIKRTMTAEQLLAAMTQKA
jgi:hypothetical protein